MNRELPLGREYKTHDRGWCYERLNAKLVTEGSKSLVHTGLSRGKGDLRIWTRRRSERFENVGVVYVRLSCHC